MRVRAPSAAQLSAKSRLHTTCDSAVRFAGDDSAAASSATRREKRAAVRVRVRRTVRLAETVEEAVGGGVCASVAEVLLKETHRN